MAAVRTIQYMSLQLHVKASVRLSVSYNVSKIYFGVRIILKQLRAGRGSAFVMTFKTNGPGKVSTCTIYGLQWQHSDSIRRLPPAVQCDYYVRYYFPFQNYWSVCEPELGN